MFDRTMAMARSAGFDHDGPATQDAVGPAFGLILAACASIVLWFGLAQAASWVAHSVL